MTSALAARETWKGPAHVRIREIGYYRNDRDQNPIGRLRSGSQLTSQTVLRATAQTLESNEIRTASIGDSSTPDTVTPKCHRGQVGAKVTLG